ncbi:MAG: hypothetical protein QXW97_03520 [Candidatus Pacearchaeota archaeon]
MKKRVKKNINKIIIEIDKKNLYKIIVILIFLIGVNFVVAVGSGNYQINGHDLNELQKCNEGQILKMKNGNWECSNDLIRGPASCKFCKSCGGEFPYRRGGIILDRDWSGWTLYGDSCSGNLIDYGAEGLPKWSLCCNY